MKKLTLVLASILLSFSLAGCCDKEFIQPDLPILQRVELPAPVVIEFEVVE